MKTSEFDFNLPEELIAQHPLLDRKTSRMMVVHAKTQEVEDKHFYDIVDYFHEGDVLVRNNTRVIPARLSGKWLRTMDVQPSSVWMPTGR